MQLSNYIDLITRAESCLAEREQDFLFVLLDSYEELYQSRRATRSEQVFWNQFWYSWDFPKLRDARKQAFDDMVADKYLHHITENRSVYRNFEQAIALDLLRVRLHILYTLGCDFSDLSQKIFYNAQSLVQDTFVTLNINSSFLPILNMDSDKDIAVPIAEDLSAKNVKDLISKVNRVTAQRKEERKAEKIRIKAERKEKARKRREERLEHARLLREGQKRKKETTKSESKWPGYCRLQIQTPKGDFIETGNSNLTFLEFVMRVGYRKVRDLGLTFEDEPIFNDFPKNGWWKEVTKGVYLCCRMNCELKIEFINRICKALNLSYTPSMTEPIDNSK